MFNEDAGQEDLYNNLIKGQIQESIQKGVNSTVFAYGQTGSGKTYTMYGDESERSQMLLKPEKVGIAQRAILEVFSGLNMEHDVEEEKIDADGDVNMVDYDDIDNLSDDTVMDDVDDQ